MSKKQYPRSYKLDVVKLAIQDDESIAKTAVNLGVHKATMYQWVSNLNISYNRHKIGIIIIYFNNFS